MKRVFVVCEGLTEMTFIREVLQPCFPKLHLIPVLPGKVYGRARGGDVKYARVRPDLVRILKGDTTCYCTTFFDYYGLGEFPSHKEPRGQEPEQKAARIENAVTDDLASDLGSSFNRARFFAYLSMHELEGLLFSDPRMLAKGLYNPSLEPELTAIRDSAKSPEHIDDGRDTAPSKQLKRVCNRYDKVTGGNLAALEVGVEAMRAECAHFRHWLEWFEDIGHPGSTVQSVNY